MTKTNQVVNTPVKRAQHVHVAQTRHRTSKCIGSMATTRTHLRNTHKF